MLGAPSRDGPAGRAIEWETRWGEAVSWIMVEGQGGGRQGAINHSVRPHTEDSSMVSISLDRRLSLREAGGGGVWDCRALLPHAANSRATKGAGCPAHVPQS